MVRVGPKSSQELFQWHHRDIQREFSSASHLETFKRNYDVGVAYLSNYSGLRTFEAAMEHVGVAVESQISSEDALI